MLLISRTLALEGRREPRAFRYAPPRRSRPSRPEPVEPPPHDPMPEYPGPEEPIEPDERTGE